MELFSVLDSLNIKYECIKHEPIYTIEEAKNIKNMLNGIGCKNLFVKGSNNYLLVILHEDKMMNFKSFEKEYGFKHLSFCDEEELNKILGLTKGSCTPFGIINDKNNIVRIYIDNDLVNNKLLFHPNRNNATISIEYNDLIKFIEYEKHGYKLFNI